MGSGVYLPSAVPGDQGFASVEPDCKADLISAVVPPHGQAVAIRGGRQDKGIPRSLPYLGNVFFQPRDDVLRQRCPLILKMPSKLNAAAQQFICRS